MVVGHQVTQSWQVLVSIHSFFELRNLPGESFFIYWAQVASRICYWVESDNTILIRISRLSSYTSKSVGDVFNRDFVQEKLPGSGT